MLIYTATKSSFIDDVRTNRIDEIIEREVSRKLNRRTPKNELQSWKNSMQYMMNVLLDTAIPNSSGVAIEYQIPQRSNRIDFILTGKDANRKDHAVIVELKQWQKAEKTDKDAIVKTQIGGGVRETNHPSYQAWSYSALIHEYNETVRDESIQLEPCAYLHNMKDGSAVNDEFYHDYTSRAPIFLSQDVEKLSIFLKKFVRYGDSDDIMYRIENGKIKPSKSLTDSLVSMLAGNQEFIMLDEQKIVHETAIDLACKAQNKDKQVLIVEGGPGTGKSVVAINLLVELTRRELVTQYVTKNSAPRAVFEKQLTKTHKKTVINNLFKGSGGYHNVKASSIDALVVDEAHRLNEKSGLYANIGENQVKELIECSNFSVFFIDDDQRVTFLDIGTTGEIEKWAGTYNATVTKLKLSSQFRCNGSDAYLAWLDNTLQKRETANTDISEVDFEIKVFENPKDLHNAIKQKNQDNKARVVAGYCWDWLSKNEPNNFDIEFPQFSYKARWNLNKDGGLYMIAPNSVNEIGCIHTCQGLEVDYIGVIIGHDLIVRDGRVITNGLARSKNDRSIRGFKKQLKENKELANLRVDEIIKNTYRTLMTRGQKGCFIYCTDKETNDYFKELCNKELIEAQKEINKYQGLIHNVVPYELAQPYVGYVPIFKLEAAAGDFSLFQYPEENDWVRLPDEFVTKEGMFVIRVVGESMNKRIPNGSWCLFKTNPAGTRNSKIVLVEHRDIEDPDQGGSYTVKRYESQKVFKNGFPENTKIVLKPETSAFGYEPIVIDSDRNEINIVGEFVAVL